MGPLDKPERPGHIRHMTITHETDLAWWVQCIHEGCDHPLTIAKRIGVPVDYSDATSETIWHTFDTVEDAHRAGYGAKWCISHGPNGTPA